MHVTPALSAPRTPIPPAFCTSASLRQPHQPDTFAQPDDDTEFPAHDKGRLPAPHRHYRRPDAGGRPAWTEGRGPAPAPLFLIRWHPADGDARHDQAETSAEALALARDARDATSADVAVYRLWSVLPD